MSAIAITPQPRIAEYDNEGAALMVRTCLESGKDPGFWESVASGIEERQARLDAIKTHGAKTLPETFFAATSLQAAPPEKIIVLGPQSKPTGGLNH